MRDWFRNTDWQGLKVVSSVRDRAIPGNKLQLRLKIGGPT
jgi:hypothetical protein